MRLGLLLALLRPLGAVHCGGHTADDCASCPQGNGAAWCNGECAWWDDGCHDKSELNRNGVTTFPYPPDYRHSDCKDLPEEDLTDLKVSIVIPWLAEKWIHMEDTLRALIHFTPDELIEEFIFVSDGNPDSREKELQAISPKVKVLALPERQGLIVAKMQGVEMAKGPVIVFMEAHCIVNKEWLQPLLRRVKLNPKTLAMPFLDRIDEDSWGQFGPLPPGHWRFEWNLNLIYSNPGIQDTAEPYPSPGTSGGIFAMRKDWFEQLGLFDPGMKEWGGDHVELTFKTWRCGGRIEIVPCSRIFHLFRMPRTRPYDVDVNRVVHNYARLARIWLKDHIEFFNSMKPESVYMAFDDQDEMMARHDKLNCKNMTWYLDNVDHEMRWEMDKLCHPHASPGDPLRCDGNVPAGRSTVTDVMPQEAFLERQTAVAAKLEL